MNFFFSIGFTSIGTKKVNLWGNEKYPVRIISFFLIEVLIFKTPVFWAFIEAIKESENLDQVWIRLAPSIRIARKQAAAKARGEYEFWKEHDLKYYREQAERSLELRHKAESELRDAKATIRHLSRNQGEE